MSQQRTRLALAGLIICVAITAALLAHLTALYREAVLVDGRSGPFCVYGDVAFWIGTPLLVALWLFDVMWLALADDKSEPYDPTVLYRHYAADDALLYVGITADLDRRNRQHRLDKPWWSQVARTNARVYPTRKSAARAEHLAIRAERPRHNAARLSLAAHLRSQGRAR